MKYSIVIPTYNHCDKYLKPCIDSVLKYSKVSDIELIVSANGCVDNTIEYLGSLKEKFIALGLQDNFKIAWSADALGYSRATNAGIKLATTDYIVLLNNDAVITESARNQWLEFLEAPFLKDEKCGITGVVKGHSEPADRHFLVFFCVMIHRKVFDKIGLLNTDYGVGGGEDTEFCIEAENAGFTLEQALPLQWSEELMLHVGAFPIYHKGEGTVHDPNLVQGWNEIFHENSLKLAKKYNRTWYRLQISNNSERGVFMKGDSVFPREMIRYKFAADNISGKNILEIGCSNGFGLQFLPQDINYIGVDNDKHIIECANDQQWRENARFVCADINKCEFDYYDTIIAFESIEHIPNGLALVERLKNHCNRMIITVPYNENPGQFSPHHVSHNLTKDNFPGFLEVGLIDINGNIFPNRNINDGNEYNLLLVWDKNNVSSFVKPPAQPIIHQINNNVIEVTPSIDQSPSVYFKWLEEQHAEIYKEVILENCYNVSKELLKDRTIIDIGANIGAFSLLAGYLGAKKVFAIEPVSETFRTLTNNISRSNLKHIIPVKSIISNEGGKIFNISLNPNSGHNSLYNVKADSEQVRSITLSDIIRNISENNIYLKLDCEGAEYDILLNASHEDMSKISEIAVEMHADLHPIHKGFQIIQNKLTSFGFTRYDEKQVYVWYYDNQGNVIKAEPIPYKVELWKR